MAERSRTGRTFLVLFTVLLCGCATADQNSQLEAAVQRFERAAAQAEAAAAAADTSAQQAAAAAARIEPAVPSGPFPSYLDLQGTEQGRRCSQAGRGPVRSAAQAVRIAQQFLRCLGLAWGKPTDTSYTTRASNPDSSFYSVEFGVEPDASHWPRNVIVDADDGHARFPLPK